MKWSEMSVFHKVLYAIGSLCLFAYMLYAVFYIAGIIPSLYTLPIAQAVFGTAWLCMGILNFGKQRKLAVMQFICASCAYVTAIMACFK